MQVIHFLFRLKEDPKDNARALQDLLKSLRSPALPDVYIGLLQASYPSTDQSGITVRGSSEGMGLAADRVRHTLLQEEIAFKEEQGTDTALSVPYPQPEGTREPPRPVEGFQHVYREGVYGFAHIAPEATPQDRARWTRQTALQSGIRFFHLGLYEDAERQLLQVTVNGEPSAEAWHFLGLVREQLGKIDEAAQALRRAIELDHHGAASHFYLANIEQKRGQLDLAVDAYKKAIEQDPEVPVIYNNLGWVFYQKGDHEAALRAFEEAIDLDPELPFAHNGLACVYQDMGDLSEAVDEFKEAIEHFPGYAAAHLKLGWTYLLTGDIASAIESLKTATQTADDSQYSVSAWYSLGHAYLSQNLLGPALDAFEEVLKQDPDFVEARFHAAEALVRLGRFEAAIPRLLDYNEKSSENRPDAYKLLATAYFHIGRYRDAASAARLALKLEPSDTEVQELLGNIATVRNRWKEAERIFRRVLEQNPASAFSHFQLGWIFENTERVPQAVEEYKKSIQIDPEATEAYNNLGWLYTEQGKKEEALVIFEKAIELNPRDVDLINNLGWTHSIMGNYREALEQYQKGLALNPSSSLLHTNLGTIYYKMGRYDEARQALSRALELRQADPSDTSVAHYYLGLMAQRNGKREDAIKHFEQATRLDPEYPEPWYPLAQCWMEQNHPRKAFSAAQQYLSLSPNGEFVRSAEAMVERIRAKRKGTE
ncbi:MAG TPA: tetratricopeptide repeat protein [Candidatus Xenobia bacterium]